jgi:hypothetical protein
MPKMSIELTRHALNGPTMGTHSARSERSLLRTADGERRRIPGRIREEAFVSDANLEVPAIEFFNN